MKKIICICNILLIYMVMLYPVLVLFGNKVRIFIYIWEHIFNNNALIPLMILIIFAAVTLILNILFHALAIKNGEDDLFLAKSNYIVKLIEIPAYIVIFAVGVICALSIFTAGFTIGLAVMDLVSLCCTGIYACTCYRLLNNKGMLTRMEYVQYSVLSFIYCADVIAAFLVYRKSRSRLIK